MKLFGVGIIQETITVKSFGKDIQLPMADWADGMVGFMPVFKTEEQAKAWAPTRKIISMETDTSEPKENG